MTLEILITIVVVVIVIFFILVVIVGIVGFFVFQQNKKFKKDLAKKEEDDKYKMYETTILNELGDKMDYSLSIQSVIDIVTRSLGDLIDYTTVSTMLIYPEKMVFNVDIKKNVSKIFVNDVRFKSINSISLLLGADFTNTKIEEKLLGSVLDDESKEQVGSFFNIPLVISGKVVGILTVADTRVGFYKKEEMTTLYKIAQQATQAVTRLQKLIDAENSKMNAMVVSMTEGVVMTDMDYKIIVVNPAAKRAVGLEDKKELLVSDFMGGLNGKFDLRDKIEESIKLEKVIFSDEISLPSGFYKIVVSPVRDNWKMLGSIIVFHDITREKEIEKIKEDFTSMIVHELRSPLDSIKKMVELMRTSEVNKTKRADCFQMIYGSSSDMLELINNLLDIAKIEAGKFQLTKQKSDIKKIVESRILFFDIAAKDAKVKIISCFGKEIPNDVEFDPHTISQVLNNLISNAIKFSKVNGSVTVQVLSHKKGESLEEEVKDSKINWFVKEDITDIPDSLLVAVTDNGIGISPDQINKLFNKFFQAKSIFVEKGGTGLGLAITKSIIDSHGGIVGVESIEGQGATFYFTLPIN
jgi:signal transduction histidine kinase